jgi:hypothetical protein
MGTVDEVCEQMSAAKWTYVTSSLEEGMPMPQLQSQSTVIGSEPELFHSVTLETFPTPLVTTLLLRHYEI